MSSVTRLASSRIPDAAATALGETVTGGSRGQLDELDAVTEAGLHEGGELDGKAGLATSRCTRQRHDSGLIEQTLQLSGLGLAARNRSSAPAEGA